MSTFSDSDDEVDQDENAESSESTNMIEVGENDSTGSDLLQSFYDSHRSKLLNAPLRVSPERPESFSESMTPPPPSCYADFDDRMYPVLRRDGCVDLQLLWGSHQYSSEELPEDDPTRKILSTLAQKFKIGIFSEQWQNPTPEFLLAKQAALGVVKRHRENFATKLQPPSLPKTTTESAIQSNPATFVPDLTLKRIRIPKDASAEDILRLEIKALQSLEKSTPSPGQRLGISAARHLLERGFFVSP